MPLKIPNDLPSIKTLAQENIFVMTQNQAIHQDIRPLKIAIVNLMPQKTTTETQLLRVLANTPLQVEVTLVAIAGHKARNTDADYLTKYYITSSELMQRKFDALIVTGAPLEHIAFCDIDYWQHLCTLMDWARTNVYSTLFICWGVEAALYYYYGIECDILQRKIAGVFSQKALVPSDPLLRGFNDKFDIPMSRYFLVPQSVFSNTELKILAGSKTTGASILKSTDARVIMITGHLEYDTLTLDTEYKRDKAAGLFPHLIEHYYPMDNDTMPPVNTWRSTAYLFYSNWLNYYVYQNTPFNLEVLS